MPRCPGGNGGADDHKHEEAHMVMHRAVADVLPGLFHMHQFGVRVRLKLVAVGISELERSRISDRNVSGQHLGGTYSRCGSSGETGLEKAYATSLQILALSLSGFSLFVYLQSTTLQRLTTLNRASET